MTTHTVPTIECPKCGSLLSNDDPKLFGRRVDCPKCQTTVTLPRIAEEAGWSEKQLLAEIRRELIKSNNMLGAIWFLAIVLMFLLAVSILVSLLTG